VQQLSSSSSSITSESAATAIVTENTSREKVSSLRYYHHVKRQINPSLITTATAATATTSTTTNPWNMTCFLVILDHGIDNDYDHHDNKDSCCQKCLHLSTRRRNGMLERSNCLISCDINSFLMLLHLYL
jgi:hypothetical protein